MGIWFADRAVARGGPKGLRPFRKIIADIGLGFLDELGPWNPLSIYGVPLSFVSVFLYSHFLITVLLIVKSEELVV